VGDPTPSGRDVACSNSRQPGGGAAAPHRDRQGVRNDFVRRSQFPAWAGPDPGPERRPRTGGGRRLPPPGPGGPRGRLVTCAGGYGSGPPGLGDTRGRWLRWAGPGRGLRLRTAGQRSSRIGVGRSGRRGPRLRPGLTGARPGSGGSRLGAGLPGARRSGRSRHGRGGLRRTGERRRGGRARRSGHGGPGGRRPGPGRSRLWWSRRPGWSWRPGWSRRAERSRSRWSERSRPR
jgi:hypothetical protein